MKDGVYERFSKGIRHQSMQRSGGEADMVRSGICPQDFRFSALRGNALFALKMKSLIHCRTSTWEDCQHHSLAS